LDREYVGEFAARVREWYPSCPPGREVAIAEHACLKYSGRVGRSAAAKSFDGQTIRLAVVAHVRHAETPYDKLLAAGYDRRNARAEVEREVAQVLNQWETPG
jgi:hypothetical protein